MWSWLDYLSALVVMPVVMLILLAVQQTGQKSSADALVRTSGRGALNDAAAWIGRDLVNIGAGVPTTGASIETYAWSGATPTFTFRAVVDTAAAAPVERITYRRQTVGARYRLVRYVHTPAGPSISGQTPPTLRAATLRLLDAAGEPVTATAQARMVEISLTMDPPLGGTHTPLVWSHRFSPPNLSASAL